MNFSLKKFLGGSLALAVATIAVSAQSAMNVGNLPLWFEAGHGQNGASGQFTAHGRDAEFSVSSSGARFVLRQADGRIGAVNLQFVGAAAAPKISGEAEQPGKINYLMGSNPSDWRSGISTFGKVRLENVYSGVNAVFYGNQQRLEYDLDLAAGVNPDTIAVRFEGAQKISVNAQGELVIGLDGGDMVQREPVAYQTGSGGVRHEVSAGYKVVGADIVEFAVGDYDHSLPLVIDPMLGYSSYFGGNHGDTGWAIALDGNTNIYVAGATFSTDISNNIPFTTNAIDPSYNGGNLAGDAFVAEFDSTGANLLYCTYLGGPHDDAAYALAVDSAGHAYVAGATDSTNFPTTNSIALVGGVGGVYDGAHIGGVVTPVIDVFPTDGFVAELDTNGARLLYSTYLGGESTEVIYGIALDPAGDAFVTGVTYSTNFPVTSDAFRTNLQCTNSFDVNANAFVSEIGAGGTNLIYSTYLGGTNYDVARGIAYTNEFVYVAGFTISTNFPWVEGLADHRILNNYTNFRVQPDHASDAFVTVFANVATNNGSSLQLVYSTFLGSTNDEVATGIAGDGKGDAYVVGWTTSTNFPDTISTNLVQLHSFVRTNNTGFVIATNAFFTQILYPTVSQIGTNAPSINATIGYSQMFGGLGIDTANAVALDPAGDVFIVGTASSTNYPTTTNLFGFLRTTNSSRFNSTTFFTDVVITAFKADFSSLLYSAYLGGSRHDYGNAIAVDGSGNAYITGQTLSTNFPTVGAFRSTLDGTNDAIVAKILLAPTPPLLVQSSGTNLLLSWSLTGGQATTNYIGLESNTNLLSKTVITTNYFYTTNKNETPPITTNVLGTVTNSVPLTSWTPVPLAPVLTNDTYTFTLNPTNAFEFYRLFLRNQTN